MKKVLSLMAVSLLMVGCSGKIVRTKQTDPVLRVAIDAPKGSIAALRVAAMKSGFFQVVDRGDGFEAALKEQNLVNRDLSHRFEKRERYARMAKLYGVGGILIPDGDCTLWSGFGGNFYKCRVTLTLVNASTAEVIAAVEDIQESPDGNTANWHVLVADLINAYPKRMINNKNPNQFLEESDSLREYKDTIIGADVPADRNLASDSE